MQSSGLIIVVEDDAGIAGLVQEVLADAGYRVRVFANGASALAAIRAQPPALVILDLELPGMRGSELLVLLRQTVAPDLPVVLMTASTQGRHWVALGATAFLAKPFNIDDLLTSIARALRAPGG